MKESTNKKNCEDTKNKNRSEESKIIDLNPGYQEEIILNQLAEILINSYFNKHPEEKEIYFETSNSSNKAA